jgi:hypothetical protein
MLDPASIPPNVLDAAQTLDHYFKRQGIPHWQLNGVCSRSFADILTEPRALHDKIDRIASSTHWSGCTCDHGEDGRIAKRRGPQCPRCNADDRINEIKSLVGYDPQKPQRLAKAHEDSLRSASL